MWFLLSCTVRPVLYNVELHFFCCYPKVKRPNSRGSHTFWGDSPITYPAKDVTVVAIVIRTLLLYIYISDISLICF